MSGDERKFDGTAVDALRVIARVVSNKESDVERARDAVRFVLKNYEAKLEVSLIAAAMVQIERVERMLGAASRMEDFLTCPSRIENAEYSDVVRAYGVILKGLKEHIDNQRQTLKMRSEIESLRRQAARGALVIEGEVVGENKENDEPEELRHFRSLSPSERELVRGALAAIEDSIKGVDEEVEEDES